MQAAESLKLDPSLPYQAQRSNPVTYDVDFSAVVTAPYRTHVLKVWLPLPQSDFGQEVTEGELITFPMQVEPKIGTEEVYGNRFAYFEFAEPQGAQIVRHKFKIKVWELHWNLDAKKVVPVTDWSADFDRYRRGDQQSVVVTGGIEALIHQVVPKPLNPLDDMAAVMSWTNAHFHYDHDVASLRASSEHALAESGGHCSDYHGFCAAMGRAMGYPTRVTYGINPFPKPSPSHCKLEAFIPPYGWVSFDVSETQKMIAELKKNTTLDEPRKDELIQAANRRLLSGFRDNTWFMQTKGTDYELAPPGARRAPVVRTICAEADGVALPDPDPASTKQHEFAWMTVHQYQPDREVTYPFKDIESLKD